MKHPSYLEPGMKFGRLSVVNGVVIPGEKRKPKTVACKCDCGKSLTVSFYNLVNGLSKSCGCSRHESHVRHGHSRNGEMSSTYRKWGAMRERCGNPRNVSYENYGARGIRVCDRWKSFEAFLEDMGECPPGLSLDRIDNNGNYEVGNCRWATKSQQMKNRRAFPRPKRVRAKIPSNVFPFCC